MSDRQTIGELQRQIDDLRWKLEQLETRNVGTYMHYSTANVSSPPTDAELDSIFGSPANRPPGFLAIINDAGGGTTIWLVATAGGNAWWYEQLTRAL